MAPELENPKLLCQDCDRKLFRWFANRPYAVRDLMAALRGGR